MSFWNKMPFFEDTPPEQKADEFDRQYEENKTAGEAKQEQDPYHRPHPSGGK